MNTKVIEGKEVLADMKRLNPEIADKLILSKSGDSIGMIVSPGSVAMLCGKLLTGGWCVCNPALDIPIERFV